MANSVYSVERAAVRALVSHLALAFGPDVQVWDHWPDAEARLTDAQAVPGQPRATITVLEAGARQDEWLTPSKASDLQIHDDITPRVTPAAVTDDATAITALNAAVTSYEAHRVDTGAHATADAANAVTAPVASNLATGITRANQFATVLAGHYTHKAHTNPDGGTFARACALKWPPAVVAAGNSSGFQALVRTLLTALNAHYAARIDLWTVATCRQPVQLDIWAGYESARDALRSRIEPLLRQNTVSGEIEASCLVALGDGWSGFADFTFQAPRITDTPDAAKRKEYRLTYPGYAALTLDVAAQNPRLALLALRARLGASQGAIGNSTAKSVEITPDGPTYTGG